MPGRRACLALLAAPAIARAASGPFRLEGPVPVHGYRAASWQPGGPLVLVLHGANRDADRYRDAWAPQADRHGFLLACPEFSQAAFPRERGYNLNPGVYPILDAVADLFAPGRDYALYGHSAGAQVAYRLVLLTGAPRASRVVAANAGWYTMPDTATPFPHGLGGLAETALPAAFAKPLAILLGEADTDPHHPQLRRDADTDRQGDNRLARGRHFFASCATAAAQLHLPFSWYIQTVPGIAHSNAGMAPAAAALLAELPPFQGRIRAAN